MSSRGRNDVETERSALWGPAMCMQKHSFRSLALSVCLAIVMTISTPVQPFSLTDPSLHFCPPNYRLEFRGLLCINENSDAPGLSETLAATSLDGGANSSGPASPSKTGGDSGEQWDDEALAAKIGKGGAIAAVGAGATTELLDMKALQKKRNEEDDIAERMRVEETRAQLAAAKEGMAKQAERLREEKEAKKNAAGGPSGGGAPGAGGSRFGAAAASIGGGGGGVSGIGGGSKWVPPHMRGAGSAIRGPASMGAGPGMGGGSSRFGNVNTSSGTFQRQVDVADENLFPDLATADTIIQQQEEQQKKIKAAVAPKRKPAAGGSAWGAKPKASAPAPAPKEEKKEEEPTKPAAAPVAPAPAASTAGPTPSSIKAAGAGLKKKKKKKDLSTFKPSS